MAKSKGFDFKAVEEKWVKYWKKNNIYKFDPAQKGEVYSIDTPPPYPSTLSKKIDNC